MIVNCAELEDEELMERIQELVRQERGHLAVLLAHLIELENRRLVVERGFSSLYQYLTGGLGYSEGAAYRRLQSSRAARSFPRVLVMLEAGELHMEAVVLLRPYLKKDNCDALLDSAKGKSRREVERIVAGLNSRPDVREHIQALSRPSPHSSSPSSAQEQPPVREVPPQDVFLPGGQAQPLSLERVHFGFTGSRDLFLKLGRARELMKHKFPAGRLEEVVGEVTDFYLDKRDPERRCRGVPQRVKDEVYGRDQGRCSFVSAEGRRCLEKSGLEYDHIIPWALGGRSDDPANIRLLCRAHNQWSAERVFK